MTATALHGRLGSTRTDFGDVGAEFRALLADCGVFDLGGRAKIALTGGDRMRWLNGMITNNVRDLATGLGVYAFLLNPQGHILGDLYTYNRGDSLLVDTDHSQLDKMLQVFDHYIIMDDVEVVNVSDKLTALGVVGPKAKEVLKAAGFEVPGLDPLQFADLTWQGTGLTLVRADNPAVECYELWLAPGNVTPLWQALVNAGARPVGTAALDLLRIASGIPRYGQDIRERDLPQETEQQRALHFTKGCYIGQEIVERIRSRGNVHRKFTGFEVQGALPALGTKMQAEGKDIGEITSVASLPTKGGERAVALGYIRREFSMPGKEVGANGARLKLTDLPFADVFKP
jgi:folate-binding protein YgfZ